MLVDRLKQTLMLEKLKRFRLHIKKKNNSFFKLIKVCDSFSMFELNSCRK